MIVLGSSGMLGSEVVRVAQDAGVEFVALSRTMGFNYEPESLQSSLTALNMGPADLVVNCIGWIPQKSFDSLADHQTAINLNVQLPLELGRLQQSLGFRWLQIGTDCVFSGQTGSYLESSLKDPVDLYGKSKALGEIVSTPTYLLRCSIVGSPISGPKSLLGWFLDRLSRRENVFGYTNHFWNGVTTTAFARIALGIFHTPSLPSIHQHLIPGDVVSKYQLLVQVAKYFEDSSTSITPMNATFCDRTLATDNVELNSLIWKIGDYQVPPSVGELLDHFMREFRFGRFGG